MGTVAVAFVCGIVAFLALSLLHLVGRRLAGVVVGDRRDRSAEVVRAIVGVGLEVVGAFVAVRAVLPISAAEGEVDAVALGVVAGLLTRPIAVLVAGAFGTLPLLASASLHHVVTGRRDRLERVEAWWDSTSGWWRLHRAVRSGVAPEDAWDPHLDGLVDAYDRMEASGLRLGARDRRRIQASRVVHRAQARDGEAAIAASDYLLTRRPDRWDDADRAAALVRAGMLLRTDRLTEARGLCDAVAGARDLATPLRQILTNTHAYVLSLLGEDLARARSLVDEALTFDDGPAVQATLGAILVQTDDPDDVQRGVALLEEGLAVAEDPVDVAQTLGFVLLGRRTLGLDTSTTEAALAGITDEHDVPDVPALSRAGIRLDRDRPST